MKFILPVCIGFALLFSSCQKEFIDESGATAGGGSSATACKDCLYFPTCNNSVYTYKDSSAGAAPTTTTDTLRFLKDTLINALTFRKVRQGNSAQVPFFINCTNGVVKNITYNGVSVGGTTLQKVEIIVLKYNEALNAQWTDTLNIQGQQALYKSTLKEKNISYTVAGRVYPDVMHVSTVLGQNVPIIGFTALATTEYYFAKGVGLIESKTINNLSGDLVLKRSLQSFFIP